MKGFVFTAHFIGLPLCILLICLGLVIAYRNGQVDALNGKIHYELIEQKNKSVKWIKVKPHTIEMN